MSAQVDQITAIIEKHLVCDCGQWAEDMHENCQHVAERVVAELDPLAALGERLLRASASLFDLEATAPSEERASWLRAKRSGVELALSYLLEAE